MDILEDIYFPDNISDMGFLDILQDSSVLGNNLGME